MNKRGFTLIELLAVIIILGILMIIAIPSVTQYINNSRKSAYIDTAKEIIAGARNRVNQGDLEMFDTEVTYYIPASMIGTENGLKSPYGDFTEAYVAVTYDGKGYNYYWISVDETGQGVKNITRLDKLDEDDIESDLKASDITSTVNNTGIGGRKIVNVLQDDYTWNIVTENALKKVSDEGGESIISICRRASVDTLHTATCNGGNGCRYHNIYANGAKITYGNQTITAGTLNPGDALDCDVNNDGTWDPITERFYYVSPLYDSSIEGDNKFDNTKSVLIYYTNVEDGTTPTLGCYAYNSGDYNYQGPLSAYTKLPTIEQWSNDQIIVPGTRQIVNEQGGTTTNSGNNTIIPFTYTDRAARLLTYQELHDATNSPNEYFSEGDLDQFNWLMENVGYYDGSFGTNGYWLETPRARYSNMDVWYVNGSQNYVSTNVAYKNSSGYYGVRPVITVNTTNIDY